MATYAISDIHGAFDEFQRLLDKLNFQYDGSDSLYLLGDYGDWGAKSMETILEVKRMDEEYEFVHCLMGNHELMFLAAIEYGITEDGARESARNWLENNHGQVTWDAYRELPEEKREELHSWLKQLPFSCDIEIEGRLFMAAHAYPFFDDMEATPQQRQRSRMDAVWRRLLPRENPFAAYSGVKSYSALICGHTITDYYYQETNRPAGRSLASALPVGHNRIYRAEHFIDIDCGAKCLEFEGEPGSAARAAADRAQLAAYCLETNEEFYVSRPQTVVGELMTGERSPELETPDIEFYELYPPEPDDRLWRPLELERGEVDYPELEPPQIGIPKIPELPELHLAGRGVDAAKRLVQRLLND